MSKINTDAGMPIALTLEPAPITAAPVASRSTCRFCDESHRGIGSMPIEFVIKEKQKVYLCSCGKTRQQPFCDSSCGVKLP